MSSLFLIYMSGVVILFAVCIKDVIEDSEKNITMVDNITNLIVISFASWFLIIPLLVKYYATTRKNKK